MSRIIFKVSFGTLCNNPFLHRSSPFNSIQPFAFPSVHGSTNRWRMTGWRTRSRWCGMRRCRRPRTTPSGWPCPSCPFRRVPRWPIGLAKGWGFLNGMEVLERRACIVRFSWVFFVVSLVFRLHKYTLFSLEIINHQNDKNLMCDKNADLLKCFSPYWPDF